LLRSFRFLLFPFSLLYGAAVWLRNWLFDKEVIKSAAFNFPIICVGNLAVGGTGKTPMVEYLIRLLKDEYETATISRGYKRKTKGFGIASADTTALEIGDEPMQFHKKFPDITVAVGEERLVAIPQLLQEKPNTRVIILDDAFQHRYVKAGLNILLTEYKDLYVHDLMMPAGDLRDIKSSAKRAECVVVTKCNPELTLPEAEKIQLQLRLLPAQRIFFTCIAYGQPYHLFSKAITNIDQTTHVLLICGIANPKPLKEYLVKNTSTYDMLRYADHHIFDSEDLVEIKKQFARVSSANKILLTTEKDGVRMKKFENELAGFPLFVLPIRHRFLFEQGHQFDVMVKSFIQQFPVLPTAGE
jgi:tetraacyldisaccharide 4'-kinase